MPIYKCSDCCGGIWAWYSFDICHQCGILYDIPSYRPDEEDKQFIYWMESSKTTCDKCSNKLDLNYYICFQCKRGYISERKNLKK